MSDDFDYSIRSELPAQPASPVQLGIQFLSNLEALDRIDPTIFGDWQIIDLPGTQSFPLADARPRIASIIQNNVKRGDWETPEPRAGYNVLAFTGEGGAPRTISFDVVTGGLEKGSATLRTGGYKQPPDLAIVTYSMFRAALLTIDAFGPPAWACAHAFKMHYDKTPWAAGSPLFPYSRFHIPWIAYLSAPLTSGVQLPAEIQSEPTQDGGLLMTATEDRLDPTNPEHLRRARVLAETMIARAGSR
jgi:hypothetical protein